MDHRLRIGYVSRNGGENRGGRESGDPIWAIGSCDLPGVDAGVVFDHAQIAAAETAIRKKLPYFRGNLQYGNFQFHMEMKKETTQHDLLSKTRPEGFEPTTIGIGIRYSIRAELRAVSQQNLLYHIPADL